jgi:phosphoglucosamine mutase
VGVDVIFAGVVSTPMIAYYSKEKQMTGIMITASHNPYQDNGIKVFNNGYKTKEDEELIIESFIDSKSLPISSFGKFTLSNDVSDTYKNIYLKLNLKPTSLKIAYDSANGANYLISKAIFDMIAPNSIQIENHPDGKNANFNCGSTHIENIISYVQSNHLDLGFAFDGDGDRVYAVDNQANIYDGDMIVYMIGVYLKKKNLLNKDTLVLTKMSNLGMIKALHDQGIRASLTDVGDKYVAQEMFANDYLVGGESCGHIILSHLLHTGDGLLVAIYILKILEELQTTFYDLTKDVTLYPIKFINIKNIKKSVLNLPLVMQKVDEIKTKLGDNSLLLVRPSGTEDLIRVTLSALNKDLVETLSNELVSFIEKEGKSL